MSKKITLINKLTVLKFRALNNIDINFGERVTVICGQNGTAKSTILGLLAQICNFEKDYATDTDINFSPLHLESFTSKYSEHFRLSEQFDFAGDLEAAYEIYDAYFKSPITPKLKFYKLQDRNLPRATVRNNITTDIATNSSRKVTHPIIYLSLNRLLPIAARKEYTVRDQEFLHQHKDEFIRINNQLLCKSTGIKFTSTTGSLESVVVHSDHYDHEAVSVGEDNAGQILQAIFSFKKLKEEYNEYHGGLLLIDEADAGLFPGAQHQLKEILNRYAKDLNLQIVMTTHSPQLIEHYYQLSKTDPKNFKTIYLSKKTNNIEIMENLSWSDICADINVQMKEISPDLLFPETNVYFEDEEARAYYSALITKIKTKKPLNLMKGISMGCGNYLELIRQKVPEFNKLSLIILDGDVEQKKIKGQKNIVQLPGELPPDQILFEFLYKLSETDPYWTNDIRFTKFVFLGMSTTTAIINKLNILQNDENFSLKSTIDAFSYSSADEDRIRILFKNFFKSSQIQQLIKGTIKVNPYRYLVSKNPDIQQAFNDRMIEATKYVLVKNKGVASHLVENWYETL